MPSSHSGVGKYVAYQRRLAKLTQQQLADAAGVALGTLRKIERNERGAGDTVLEALAEAMRIDLSKLLPQRSHADARVHTAMPALSAALATYDMPEEGPFRPLRELRDAVTKAEEWRLGAQYVLITSKLPGLLTELSRALVAAQGAERQEVAALLVSAYRTADAVAFKYGAKDLSARLIGLMKWAAAAADDQLLDTTVAYVGTEIYFAARAYRTGLRALEAAINAAPPPQDTHTTAARGALHMRAAVVAGRAGDANAANLHLLEARTLGARVREGVYAGTAFGPHSVRIHQVSVAVSLGDDHLQGALDAAHEWAPPQDMPAERRSGFYIELARAQLWTGRPDDAFESLRTARRIAPQHTREHRWVREVAGTLRRLKRADAESLTRFAEWCHATG
ncbi:helix-turn-helix transcriptional regulator [Streptomyces sp. AV19]|uniref:helix-turn-helix domain-containing protein n=1 Tax=Streptomyces sp. AV19 TaxID=2793068 RepID=UPI0018FEC607|nr:helix-turn-helix transcriptional regulator [Streptomyces sp. AV19]MBH1937597.1 helix-turn-helix transcriptional regulator [Streptomyces sp. AV19]MDG4536470.1 helix-turn-helix domain-containing protein [Streptomyces sp. AV19]